MATPGQLVAAGVKATAKPSLVIETFEGDWEKEWFTYKPEEWARRTHKIYDDKWQTPRNARLAFEVRSAKPNKIVIGIDHHAAEIQLTGTSEWQSVTLSPGDFGDAVGEPLPGWENIKELRIGAKERLRTRGNGPRTSRSLGADWQGAQPEFRNLRWSTPGRADGAERRNK